jgi:hypothetical protein
MAEIVAREPLRKASDDLTTMTDDDDDARSSSSSSSSVSQSFRAHEDLARQLAARIEREWGVRVALALVNRHGVGLVSQVLGELNELHRAGVLPAIRNPGGYFMRCVLEAAKASAARGERWVEGLPTPNPAPPTAFPPRDTRLDPYRPLARYVKNPPAYMDFSQEPRA